MMNLMTIDVATLQAGPELNALVTEKWMEWRRRVSGNRQIVRDDACLNLAHTHCEYCDQLEGDRHIAECQWLDRKWQWDMREGDYEDEDTPKRTRSQDWSPSTNPAHAGEARRKAQGWDLHTFNHPNPGTISCTLLVGDEMPAPGQGLVGWCKFCETNGDKGKAEALATCRAIVAALKTTEGTKRRK